MVADLLADSDGVDAYAPRLDQLGRARTVEHEALVRDRDLGTVLELDRAADLRPVHERPRCAVQVGEQAAVALDADDGVVPGDGRCGEDEVVVGSASDADLTAPLEVARDVVVLDLEVTCEPLRLAPLRDLLDPRAELWNLLDQRSELPRRQREQPGRGLRAHVRRTLPAVEERDLAEEVTGGKPRELPLLRAEVGSDDESSRFDHIEAVGLAALGDDHFAGRNVDRL